ncbi:MAG: PD40 domain-containing protein [Candidatus Cloacimonetes bacterium]|nr:PD40 domain-containing protein [Candidatus Cloacimonadota bacterium]
MKKAILLFLLITSSIAIRAYSFGQNKIQKTNLKWSLIETMHFDVYFNEGDEEFGKIVALMAEEAYYYLKKDFKTPLVNRIPVIFYKSHQDFATTNVIFPLLSEGVGGFTESGKNRVAVPFNGSYRELEEVFIHELTHAYVNELNRLRNRFLNLSGLPFWLTEGLPEFQSVGGKSYYNNMFIIDLLLNSVLPDLNDVGGYYAYRLGESFLTYISEKYGRDIVMELFYALRISSSLDNSVNKVFGMNFKELQLRWGNYLKKKYFQYVADYKVPYEEYERATDHTEDGSYYNFAARFSPDGHHYVYFSNKNLRSDIWKGETIGIIPNKKLIAGESTGRYEEFHFQKNNLSWMPDSKTFAFVAKTSFGDRIYLVDYNKGNIIRYFDFFEFDAIYEIDISHDGSKIVFTGQKNLQNDLYIFDMTTEETVTITNDYYNDFQPRWSPDDTKITFTSERTIREDDTDHLFYQLKNDIFYYDLTDSTFYQVTIGEYNNQFPIWNSTGDKIVYVAESIFASNFEVVDIFTGTRACMTRSIGGVFSGDLNYDDSSLIFSCFYNGGWDIYLLADPFAGLVYEDYQLPRAIEFVNDFYKRFDINRFRYFGKRDREFKREYQGQYAKNYTTINLRKQVESDSLMRKHNNEMDEKPNSINIPQIRPYRTKFTLDRLWGGMAYSPSGGTYAQIEFGLSDLMGNHAIGVNVGISGELDNSNFILNYLYLARRIDYGLGGFYLNDEIVYRIEYLNSSDIDYMREREREFGVYTIFRYPFNRFWRIDFENVIYKNEIRRDWWDDIKGEWIENYIQPNTIDEKVYESELIYTPQISIIHDNTIYGTVGPISGWRSALLFNRSFSTKNSSSIIYTDNRNYLFFAKRYSIATRALGGVILGTSNQRFSFDYFNGVRGFDDEDLEGTRKFLASLELRVPFIDNIRIAFPLPLFVYNIRGSVFVDAGAIWEDDDELQFYQKDRLKDLKFGFGFGPRINLGYFVLRFDIAWNSNLVDVSKPYYYLTLSPDF